jgi:hypothetical protein
MGPGITIQYRMADTKGSVLPWTEYRNSKTGETRTYVASAVKDPGPTRTMQCADCHNRPGHAFELPAAAVDAAMTAGRISTALPFAHKTAVQVLTAKYASDADAGARIPANFAAFYRENYAALAGQRQAEIARAATELAEIYARNVYADLGVRWGSYPDQLGHSEENPGCFRCHDESLVTSGGKTMSQDCDECHQRLAVGEKSPEILKTLGVGTNER